MRGKIGHGSKHRSWDEYFMRLAEIVKTRSSYLSPAKGARNCDEGGAVGTHSGEPGNTRR